MTPATERTLPVNGIDLHLAGAGPGGRPTASSPTSPAALEAGLNWYRANNDPA